MYITTIITLVSTRPNVMGFITLAFSKRSPGKVTYIPLVIISLKKLSILVSGID